MAEPVDWRADGVPRSARFDDIYHTETGALAQARHVFLAGCGLPPPGRDSRNGGFSKPASGSASIS